MYNFRITSFLFFTSLFFFTELFWASLAWVLISNFIFSSGTEDDEFQPGAVRRGRGGLDDYSDDLDEDPLQSDNGAATPTSTTIGSTILHPLAPADDDSEDIPRPRRGIYATPETTPAPQSERGHEGDVEDEEEEDSEDYEEDDTGRRRAGGRSGRRRDDGDSDEDLTPTIIEESKVVAGGATDSGIGSSRSEGRTGSGVASILQRRRSGKKP